MKNFYSTRLVSRSTGFLVPLGILSILLGIAAIILSSIELDHSRTTVPVSIVNSTLITESVPSLRSEQSIWPTLGKGIWTGLFFIGLGILSLVAHREKTLISIRLVSLLALINAFLSLYLFLCSILLFQPYVVQTPLNTSPRTSYAQKEITLNALLFVVGVLSFLNSLAIGIGCLVSGNFCQAELDDDDDDEEPKNPGPRAPPATFATPPAYFR